MHNVFISDINLYKEETSEGSKNSDMNRGTNTSRGLDKMLTQVFEEVKSNQTKDAGLITLIKI